MKFLSAAILLAALSLACAGAIPALAVDQTITLTPGDTVTVVAPGGAPTVPPPAPVPPPPPAPAPAAWDLSLPLTNVGAYLIQQVAPDGSFPVDYSAANRYLTVSDTLTWRKRDYPGTGYFASDALLHPMGWVRTWQAAPFGQQFNPAASDGGEFVIYGNSKVWVAATQDGSTPGIQYFVGASCSGGDGWGLWDVWPPTGSWASQIFALAISSDPRACPPLNYAYTRWRREVLPIYFTIAGKPQTITRPCIVYEHYNGTSVADAVDMEQAGWCLGNAGTWWIKYGPGPATVDLSARMPALPWPGPPEHAGDWVMLDARLYTNIVAVGPGEADKPLWPPAGFVP